MAEGKNEYSREMKAKTFDIEANRMICLLNHSDADELGVFPLDRVELTNLLNKKRTVTVVDITKTMLQGNQVGIFKDVAEKLSLKSGKKVRVRPVEKPESLHFIKRKMNGETLGEEEIKGIVRDIGDNKLSELEVAAFITAVYIHGYTLDETVAMTKALTEDGKQLKLEKGPVLDKHCVGGTNGRTTMIIVPIVAAAGYYIPKTSSRSITSAAGTADVMEVLADVCLPLSKIKKVTEKIGGVIAWGGALDLAPVDDEIIRVEHPFSLDPPGQIIASVMAKKASVGSKYVVVDLPVGPDVKIHTKEKAADMAKKIIAVGKKLGMKVEAVLTDGTEPSGRAFGPGPEAKYVMEILEGKFFDNLAQKSCELAGVLFELVGKTKKGRGYALAKEILQSGKALKKMKEIIKAQGAKHLSSEEIKQARLRKTIKSTSFGEISSINVRECIKIAKIAGAPGHKKAGLFLHVEEGEKIKKGQKLFTIYSENKRKLQLAERYAKKSNVIELQRIILQKFQ